LTPSGLLLTKSHAVAGAAKIKAIDLGNGRTYSAAVLGYDESADVAIVQPQGAMGLAPANLGISASAKVGEPVVATGNAGGAGGTPSAASGKIVALDQQITASDAGDGTSERLSGLIETNTDIQSGDSGGPLVNASGQVLAMNTAASSGFSSARCRTASTRVSPSPSTRRRPSPTRSKAAGPRPPVDPVDRDLLAGSVAGKQRGQGFGRFPRVSIHRNDRVAGSYFGVWDWPSGARPLGAPAPPRVSPSDCGTLQTGGPVLVASAFRAGCSRPCESCE
jgi:hypothetical protein